ncbi:MAG: 3-hydroxyacyl-CoA dehydrogenase NAD-binding domain-containing protein [Pseudomonadota bacterium]
MAQEHWSSESDADGIVWLRLDKSDGSANVLSGPVLAELNELLEPLPTKQPKGVVVYSGKSSGFIMGADINEFTKIENPDEAYQLIRQGQQVLDKLEALPCPTVAAMNGFALGGGLELAMACDYRLAFSGDRKAFGLPEVQLGIHPGFGGTVRAVQIMGVRPAMQLMLTGAPMNAAKARKLGLIDRIASSDNWRQAAKELIATKQTKQSAPLVEKLLNLPLVRGFIKPTLVKQVARKARKDHYPAPYAIIDLWAKHGASSSTGYEAEARSIAELMCTDTSRNLVRVFFLQNQLKSQGNKTDRKVENVHVVGAGVMGGDIASWCALRGLNVSLQDREMKYIQPALDRAQALFAKRIRDDEKRRAATERLVADVEASKVADADLIIEAIFEDADAKKSLYASLQSSMKDGALLSTNTSSIRLEDLRSDLNAPSEFIGLHFFNPVAQMMIVEVIRCEDTTQAALDAGFAFVKKIGKLPLECRSAPGFVVNRILGPYMAEAMGLIESGVALANIDKAAEKFGMPMGPVELIDNVGLDVALSVSKVLGAAMDRPVPERLVSMVESGKLGRKSGEGFYTWEGKTAQKPEATGAVPTDIEDRLILPMVNEAVACLADGIVADPDLLDAGVIFGTGFAPFRGGPIHYARTRGLDTVKDALNRLADTHGEHFRPHPGFDFL